ncbi:MAG: hypothetical protein H7067_19395 [Burkholderiales bacterium]|nr:hypothetical protein [Opitutaceae bacterium]
MLAGTPASSGLRVKARLVGDDDAKGARIGLGDLTQEKGVGILINRSGKDQLHAVVLVHLHGLVQVAT